MFLNKQEIVKLTGRKTRSLQIRWLAAHGYKHEISAIGNPIVLKIHLEERLSGSIDYKNKRTQEPDFSSLGAR